MFEPTPQAIRLLEKRYFRKGENWEGMCERIATAVAENKQQKDDFYNIIVKALFLPNTPCLVNAGKENGQLCACFILPIEDSIESIFDSVKDAALIFKTGGGCGYDFSKLRPEGSMVASTRGVSGGPIAFLKIFNTSTKQLKQGGVRRGANMGSLRVDHPDIIKFIKCKDEDKEIDSFNISVSIIDKFMEHLNDRELSKYLWRCNFNEEEYYIRKKDDRPIRINEIAKNDIISTLYYTVDDLWNLLVHQAWKNGEPGILFLDEIQRKNGSDVCTTNPCGEVGGGPYTACVLGSIDVSKFVKNGTIDYSGLIDVIKIATEFLDRVIGISKFPLLQITEKTKKERQIGLGVMGFADLLIKLKIRYGSEKSYEIAEELIKLIHDESHKISNNKNKFCTAIAPTGSISIIAGCSSGIEPNFAWKTITKRKDFDEQTIVHPLAVPFFDEDKFPDYFVVSGEINYKNHIRMQSIFQNNGTDLGVSKTIIFSENTVEEDISEAFKLSWKSKCKGVTVYRDGSRENQVLSDAEKDTHKVQILTPRIRPRVLFGATYRLMTPSGRCFLTINEDKEGIREVFIKISKSGSEIGSHTETEGRLISNSLKHRIPIKSLVRHLKDQKSNPIWERGRSVKSVPDAVAKVIEDYIENYEGFSEYIPEDTLEYDGEKIIIKKALDLKDTPVKPEYSGGLCPECGEVLYMESNCEMCHSCGYSLCG